ncbi:MAG: hypothetical protein H6739_07730 [Alphaproteobacteria bacterium]|nr:hypothetical protein [Alphaproteobacteria bacterium]
MKWFHPGPFVHVLQSGSEAPDHPGIVGVLMLIGRVETDPEDIRRRGLDEEKDHVLLDLDGCPLGVHWVPEDEERSLAQGATLQGGGFWVVAHYLNLFAVPVESLEAGKRLLVNAYLASLADPRPANDDFRERA